MVLIADKLSPKAVSDIEKLGYQVTMNPDLGADDIPSHIQGVEVLIVRSTKVLAKTIENADNLSLIIRAGAGVNTIDLAAASAKGIHVANCPGKNTDAVAELVMGHLIAADRRIVSACIDLKNGLWNKKEYGKAAGLKGRTLGIIGLGAIGTAVGVRAKAFGMDVAAWSRSLTPEKAESLGFLYCKEPLDVAKISDAVSVHLAMSPATKHFIDTPFFDALKPGAIFLNSSRGETVRTEALVKAIDEKGIKAGLDVFENEPGGGKADFDQTDLLAKTASATPHIGASTDQAAEAIAGEAVRIIEAYKNTGHPVNCVNKQEKSNAAYNLVVRHFNRVGVLASILDELKKEGINIEEMENNIFQGGEAAVCTMKLDQKPASDFIDKIRKEANIIQIVIKAAS